MSVRRTLVGVADEIPLPPCGRCGHTADDHRIDDTQDLGPCDPGMKFRCVGRPIPPDRFVETNCDCPDYRLLLS